MASVGVWLMTSIGSMGTDHWTVAAGFPKKFRVTDDTNPDCGIITIGIDIHSRFHIAWPFIHSILSSECSWTSVLLFHTLRDATSLGNGLLVQAIGWSRAGTLYCTRISTLWIFPVRHLASTISYTRPCIHHQWATASILQPSVAFWVPSQLPAGWSSFRRKSLRTTARSQPMDSVLNLLSSGLVCGILHARSVSIEADKFSNSWRFLQHGRRRSSGNHAYNGMNSCILGQRVLLTITRLSLPSTTLSLILSCSFNASTTEGSPSVTRNRRAKLPTLRMAMRQSVRLLWTTPMPVLVMSSRELLVLPMLMALPTAHALSQLTANT